MKKTLFTISIILFGGFTVYGLSNTNIGTYTLSTSLNSNIYVDIINDTSDVYDSGKRIDIIQNYNIGSNDLNTYSIMGTGILDSDFYGDFYINDRVIELINDNSVNSNCTDVSYSFSGELISPSFGKLKIQPGIDNYFCPTDGKNNIPLHSDILGSIVLSGSIIKDETITVKNSRGEDQTISTTDILDNKDIAISGITNIGNTTGLDSDYSENTNINIFVQIDGRTANLNRIIDENLVKYTKGLSPKIINNNLTGFSKKIHYYDFEGSPVLTSSNIDNKGKILKIGIDSVNKDENYYKMGIAGQKLLYVKGGNVYIDADISNNSKTSQLVIIVKRDSTNRKNGGNVYINPEVTNIDATIIADGSILSYDGNKVLNTDTDFNTLKKQLLIYGSISTKNTFGEDKAIYGTDSYIDNGGEQVTGTGMYNLAKLRNFSTTLGNFITGTCNENNKIVARGNTSSGSLEYAFAGKKKCYLSDTVENSLRGTEKMTPLVIEYNPIIQTNPHFILESN